MEVELDIFSGQPNPRWQLDQVKAGRLGRVIRDLQAVSEAPADDRPTVPGLGYRGFVFELDQESWRAWRGIVWSKSVSLADHERSVEKLLLSFLPDLYRGLSTRVLVEIERDS